MRSLVAVLLLAACGDDGVTPADAPIDAAVDAAVDASTRIHVFVHFADRSPASGIVVVFHSATGQPVQSTTTDSEGLASVDSTAVTMVTVAAYDPTSDQRELYTYVGLPQGGTVHTFLGFGGATSPPASQIGTLAVTFPPNAPSGTNVWNFDINCANTSVASPATFAMDVFSNCRRPNSNLVDAIAYALENATLVGYLPVLGIDVAATGSTPVDLSTQTWRTDFLDYELTVSNMPAGATSARPQVTLDVKGAGYARPSPPASPVAQGEGITRTFRLPRDFGTSMYPTTEVYYGETSPRGLGLYARKKAIGDSDSIDANASLLPRILTTATTGRDSVRPRVSWTTAGSEVGADLGIATLSWANATWAMHFPPTTVSPLQVPLLPDALAAFRPPTDNTVDESAFVVFYDADYIDGYAAFLATENPTRPDTYVERSTRYPL
jgi:hypothetical protein